LILHEHDWDKKDDKTKLTLLDIIHLSLLVLINSLYKKV